MKGAKQHNKRELMAIRRTIESVFSVLKYYEIENILARSIDGFQQTVEIIVLTYLQYQLTSTKLKQTYETYLALHDALMVKKHPAELANLLATYEPNGTAMDMTIATLKRHKVAVLAAVTSPYSNGPIEGVNRLIKSLKRSCFGFKNQLKFLQTNLPNHGIT